MVDNNGSRNEDTSVLTIRIPKSLKDNIDGIKNRMNSKLSRVVQNYLKLSEIMIVREDNTKFGIDNDGLCIFPESLIKYIFDILKENITSTENFQMSAKLGDEMGKYLNNIFSLKDIDDSDYVTMFEIIKNFGWFNYTISAGSPSYILIPKSFGTKPMVYALVYRILTKTRFPPEWDSALLDTPEKGERKDRYKNIKDELSPYIKKQNAMNFYFFRKLKISSKKIAQDDAEN